MSRRPKHRQKLAPAAPVVHSLPGWRMAAAVGALLAVVTLTYLNHFHNSFHFDDYHTIVANPYIRDLHNLGLFFRDARTVDSLPASQTYRPLNAVSFAVDYWLGHGLHPLWFQISTFIWYLGQLTLMVFVFRRVFDAARPDPRNTWVALFATALYGLHPAMAETVNYIVQRADLYSTFAVLAGLSVYIFAPRLRRYGVYLVPIVVGLFAKQPTAVFPALLFAWIWLFEEEDFMKAVLRSLPAFIVTGAVAYLVLHMASASFFGGAASAFNYRISQPAVLFSYFRRFFLPIDLSADTDRKPYTSLLDWRVLGGILFIVLVCAAILWLRRRRETRPVSFGLFWFLAACGPTSWIPLAEVENDHRLFFPFVGLAMGLTWACALWLYRHPLPRPAVIGACAVVLASAAWGAHQRNIVWHTDESLWFDVTRKSPGNGRGLMNYGLSLMTQARYKEALDYFTRALVLNPYYPTLEVNLGVVNGSLHNKAEAEKHFRRALSLAPKSAEDKMFYARWLSTNGRVTEGIAMLRRAEQDQPDYIEAPYMLMQIYARLGDRDNLRREAEKTLALFPADTVAKDWLAKAPRLPQGGLRTPVPLAVDTPPAEDTAEGFLNRSLVLYQAGKYQECIAAAREALKIQPKYAAAWNNIMAAYNALSDWDDAIAAGRMAVSLDPESELAKNNLAVAMAEKLKAKAPPK
jgi:tetratricopeptide (TPR) repeat protein